jgi:hypothetical protein
MNNGSASGPTESPARAVLTGGAGPGVAVGLIVSGVSLISSPSSAASALLGAGLAWAALATGPITMMIVKNWSPPAVMLAAMSGYVIAMIGVGMVCAILAPEDWVRGGYAGWTLLATLIAWITGQVRATSRLRFLAFGKEIAGDGTPADDPDSVAAGSPQSPRRAPH